MTDLRNVAEYNDFFCLFVNESNHLFIDFRADHFRFGFYQKKIIKSKLKKKQTEPKPVQTDRFRFGLIF